MLRPKSHLLYGEGPGFTPASEHVAVSCAARHEPRARRRANPARFPIQLRPRFPIQLITITRPLSIGRRRRLHSTHALKLPRVTRLTHLTITLTLGHAAACSCMQTVISLTYSDLTHAVPLTHRASLTQTLSLAPVVLRRSLPRGPCRTAFVGREVAKMAVGNVVKVALWCGWRGC